MTIPSPSQAALRPMLVVGNYCHDSNIMKDGQQFRGLGGAPSFIDALFNTLHQDYDLISKVGPDFDYLQQVSKAPLIGKNLTTHFQNDYRSTVRQQCVSARADCIEAEDIKHHYQVSMGCAIGGEISAAALKRLAQQSKILIVDIQGLIRTFDPKGKVGAQDLKQTPYWSLLDKITYLKVNPQEAEFLPIDEALQKTTLIITEGEKGCRLLSKSNEQHIAAYPIKEVDPTGAGDSFMAGLAWALLQGWKIEDACQLGNYCGSVAASHIGIPKYSLADIKNVMSKITKHC